MDERVVYFINKKKTERTGRRDNSFNNKCGSTNSIKVLLHMFYRLTNIQSIEYFLIHALVNRW